MANIDAEIGDLPVTGNIGVRRDTKQSSTVLRDVSEDIVDELGNVIDTVTLKTVSVPH